MKDFKKVAKEFSDMAGNRFRYKHQDIKDDNHNFIELFPQDKLGNDTLGDLQLDPEKDLNPSNFVDDIYLVKMKQKLQRAISIAQKHESSSYQATLKANQLKEENVKLKAQVKRYKEIAVVAVTKEKDFKQKSKNTIQ